MISPSFIAEVPKLAHAIAPEIDQPVYVLPHPADLPTPSHCLAYTFPVTSVPIRDRLVSEGRWQGPGPLLCLVDDFERDTLGNRLALLGLALHELAHHLPFVALSDESRDEARVVQLAQFCEWANEDRRETRRTPWQGHGLRFIRTCLHVHFRVQWHAHRFRDLLEWHPLDRDTLMFAGPDYGLSHSYNYRNALGNEPSDCIDETFASILARPAPQAFAELFRADVTAWHHHQIEQEIAAA
jgi:hypothetical protein